MRNDKLWQDDGVQKALAILQFYPKMESQVLFTTSGENYDGMPPNHVNHSDLDEDNNTLRVGTADNYCSWCNKTIRIMKKRNYRTYARIINDWFLRGHRLPVGKEILVLPYETRKSFYENLPKAIQRFSIECPTYIFNHLYKFVVASKHQVNN